MCIRDREQRQWAAAEGYYRQALAIQHEFNDLYSQASTLHQLGSVAQAQRQWAAAEGYYRQALALYVEFNDRYSQASTLGQLGLLAEGQEQWAVATEYLLQSLSVFRELSDSHSLGITIHILARIWRMSADMTIPGRAAAVLDLSEIELVALLEGAVS